VKSRPTHPRIFLKRAPATRLGRTRTRGLKPVVLTAGKEAEIAPDFT
jgi:hypothetical protein